MDEPGYEIHKIWVPITWDRKEEKGGILGSTTAAVFRPLEYEGTDRAWEAAVAYASNGWDLVAAIPILGGFLYEGIEKAGGFSYTDGYILLLKRPMH